MTKSISTFSLFALCALALPLISNGFAVSQPSDKATADKAPADPNQVDPNVQTNTATAGVGIEPVFERLRFQRPVFIGHAGDQRLFVVEQNGIIRVFDNDPDVSTTQVFLDISDRISRAGNEEGLLGLAFHPDFLNNGQFFVHYSSSKKDMHGIIARYRVDQENPQIADPQSEEILLEQPQPFRNHNGGAIAFGPDGYLYISFGDGGKANDPLGSGQDISTLLGSILRIDVDRQDEGLNYAIPIDNPFVDRADARGEIFAMGLRNVWRFSFDRTTGELWAGDVGQNETEEIDIITRGGNYGWNRFEADDVFADDTKLAIENDVKPVATYSHQWGLSVTGGHVYRGKQYPTLEGSYFFGDYVSGNLWQTKKDDDGQWDSQLVRRTGRSIASFGEDVDGEVYLVSFDGRIYRIVPTDEPENFLEGWPRKLSETEIFTDVKKREMNSAFTQYFVNAPFWSDYADKTRYVKLPADEKMKWKSQGSWEVPVGTEIIKNFRDPSNDRMLETRLIKRTQTGWEAATYVWDPKGHDAELFPQGKQFELRSKIKGKENFGNRTWHSPSSSECSSCHVDAAGYVLGLNTAQLNDVNGDENQIKRFSLQGILSGLPESFSPAAADRHCNPSDTTCALEDRARVTLEVNCAMCHRPDGPGNAKIDLRFTTALDQTLTVGAKPAQGDLGIADAQIIHPGHPEKSILLHRMSTLGSGRMPNIGSNMVDEKAVELLRQWIISLAE